MILELLNSWAVSFDLPILEWIRANLTHPILDKAMPIITMLADAGIFWIALALILLFVKKQRKNGLAMLLAMLMGLVVCNILLKPAVARIRPYDLQESMGVVINLLVEKQSDFSFPSGHTISSFCAAVALVLGNRKLGIPAILLAILIGFSRLYLYVHYPTDVIASVILGTFLGIICHLLTHGITFSMKGKYLRK